MHIYKFKLNLTFFIGYTLYRPFKLMWVKMLFSQPKVPSLKSMVFLTSTFILVRNSYPYVDTRFDTY